MKISNSKKELARIISENGGWREGADTCSCDNDGYVNFFVGKPTRNGGSWLDNGDCKYIGGIITPKYEKIANWHQTVLSRAEYFHLYPAPDAKPQFCESVMRSIPDPEAAPTIEQLAADYRNAKDYAERKQQDADDAKADADEKLRVLEIAGEALGLLVSPITTKQEPGLVITNRSQLELGDVIWLSDSTVKENNELTPSGEYTVVKVGVIGVESDGQTIYPDFSTREWRFIRRP